MPTDSTRSACLRDRRAHRAVYRSSGSRIAIGIAIAAGLALSGCLSRPAVVVEELLVPIAPSVPWLPAESDLAAARLAEVALAAPTRTRSPSDAIEAAPESVEAALSRLEASGDAEDLAGLLALGQDVRNATLDDPIAYRDASRRLRKRRGLDARLENRLDRIIEDDPLRLARRRQRDDWERLWARTFNAVSEPLGSSLITGFVIAPYTLANSIIHYLAAFSNSEPLSKTGRQALVHRQEFLARHPDSAWTPELEEKVARDQILLEETLALRRVRLAERSLDADRPGHAQTHAASAVQVLSAHPESNGRLRRRAESALSEAQGEIARIDRLNRSSLDAKPSPEAAGGAEAEISLASAILAGPIELAVLQPEIARYLDAGGRMDRVEYVRATAQHEGRFESESRDQLERLTRRRPSRSTMARHAKALVDDEWQNPYPAFERLRAKGVRDELAWRLAGEWVRRPRYPNLPTPVAYLIDTPTIAITIVLAPLRALLSPLQEGPDFGRAAALAGYRYLVRFPEGANQDEVVEWLFDYELDHDRYGRALRLADLRPSFDPEERRDLVEKTAEARRLAVERVDRRDARASILKGVAKEFPDSEQAREAGLQAREEALDASAQHIRITKGFLLENPDVAGRSGIGLDPRLLNDDPADAELHPEGVVLRGGRMLEIRLIAEDSDDEDPPESRFRKVGKARLAQIASALDAAVHRNSLADLESRQTPDANRDVFLERAALELTEEEDLRPTAESSYVYQSLRERYGLVRGRDSVLPFDLVFRGSLGDFTLGAFPRWRAPRETPDAFLYR